MTSCSTITIAAPPGTYNPYTEITSVSIGTIRSDGTYVVNLNGNLRNSGALAGSSTVTTTFNGATASTRTVSVGANGSTDISTSFGVAGTPGTYPACFAISGVTPACANVVVPTPATANISLDAAVTVTPTNPKVGDTVTITGTVRNTGSAAGNVVIGLRFNGVLQSGITTTQGLNANTNATVSLRFVVSAGTVGTSYPTCLEIIG